MIFDIANYRILGLLIVEEKRATIPSVFKNPAHRILNVQEIDPIILHSGVASARIRASRYGLIPPSSTTSTRQLRSSSRSCWKPTWSNKLRSGAKSTNTSRSLSAVSSPRATEPKIRTFRAPCFVARRKISSRRSLTCSMRLIFRPREDDLSLSSFSQNQIRGKFALTAEQAPVQSAPRIAPFPAVPACQKFRTLPPSPSRPRAARG